MRVLSPGLCFLTAAENLALVGVVPAAARPRSGSRRDLLAPFVGTWQELPLLEAGERTLTRRLPNAPP